MHLLLALMHVFVCVCVCWFSLLDMIICVLRSFVYCYVRFFFLLSLHLSAGNIVANTAVCSFVVLLSIIYFSFLSRFDGTRWLCVMLMMLIMMPMLLAAIVLLPCTRVHFCRKLASHSLACTGRCVQNELLADCTFWNGVCANAHVIYA